MGAEDRQVQGHHAARVALLAEIRDLSEYPSRRLPDSTPNTEPTRKAMSPVTRSAAGKRRRSSVKPRAASIAAPTAHVKPLGTLNNPNHPIFRPGNLCLELAEIDEEIFSPVLKLASQLLVARFNLSFWHTVLFSDVKYATDIIYSAGRAPSYEYLHAPSELSSEEERRTKQALLQLADHVKIRMPAAQEKDRAVNKKTSSGCTRYLGKDLAMITLSRSLVMDHIKYAQANDHYWRVYSTIHLAKILIHELAHAATKTTRGSGHYFFPGLVVSEDGFEVECRLFGGILELRCPKKSPSTKHNIILEAWPSRALIAMYVENGGSLGLRLLAGPRITSRPGDCIELVPFSFLEKLFNQSFWDDDVAVLGRQALRPPSEGWIIHKYNAKAIANLEETYKRRRDAWDETARCQHAIAQSTNDRVSTLDGVSYVHFPF